MNLQWSFWLDFPPRCPTHLSWLHPVGGAASSPCLDASLVCSCLYSHSCCFSASCFVVSFGSVHKRQHRDVKPLVHTERADVCHDVSVSLWWNLWNADSSADSSINCSRAPSWNRKALCPGISSANCLSVIVLINRWVRTRPSVYDVVRPRCRSLSGRSSSCSAPITARLPKCFHLLDLLQIFVSPVIISVRWLKIPGAFLR